jgi:hypothetical protein
LALVTKMMADMIWGPANMVRARGKIARFMISSQYTAARFRCLQCVVQAAGIGIVTLVGETCSVVSWLGDFEERRRAASCMVLLAES